jgi:hypothetical protein
MSEQKPDEIVTITVPSVSGTDAATATDLVEDLVQRYEITAVDADALFNACVSIYVRGRMVYGDRPPSVCSLATFCSSEPPDDRN